MKRMMLIALLLATISGGLSAYDVEDYMPLYVGNSWTTWDSSADGIDTLVSEIIDTATMFGHLTYVFEDRSVSNPTEPDTSYMQLRPDGLYSLDKMDEETDTVLTPMRVVINPFNIGDRWEIVSVDTSFTEGPVTIYQHIAMNGQAAEVVDVSVPAGNFSDCVKIRMYGEWNAVAVMGTDTLARDSGSVGEHAIWVAEGIGPVKFYDQEIEGGGDTLGPPDTTEMVSKLIEYDLSKIYDRGKSSTSQAEIIEIAPNPFYASCKISVPRGAEAEILRLDGTKLKGLEIPTGEYEWTPAQTVNSGIYIIHLLLPDGSTTSEEVIYLK